mmetsp:Transcript_49658/g.121233  ORF Transcript_49658/g.121233 Transcript_49658/m.121233 type:complete len:287 (+) Transcript_49658:308-1168(+)
MPLRTSMRHTGKLLGMASASALSPRRSTQPRSSPVPGFMRTIVSVGHKLAQISPSTHSSSLSRTGILMMRPSGVRHSTLAISSPFLLVSLKAPSSSSFHPFGGGSILMILLVPSLAYSTSPLSSWVRPQPSKLILKPPTCSIVSLSYIRACFSLHVNTTTLSLHFVRPSPNNFFFMLVALMGCPLILVFLSAERPYSPTLSHKFPSSATSSPCVKAIGSCKNLSRTLYECVGTSDSTRKKMSTASASAFSSASFCALAASLAAPSLAILSISSASICPLLWYPFLI